MNRSSVVLGLALSLIAAVAIAKTTYEAAYARILAEMHAGMAMASTGDADLDFAMGMIPHHEGAVAMAELQLEYGTDPELRALSETIIRTQSEEIAFLKDWIARQEAAAN